MKLLIGEKITSVIGDKKSDVKNIATSDLAKALAEISKSMETPLLPSNCIYFFRDEKQCVVALVFDSSKYSVDFSGDPSNMDEGGSLYRSFYKKYIESKKIRVNAEKRDYDEEDEDELEEYQKVFICNSYFQVHTPVTLYIAKLRNLDSGKLIIHQDFLFGLNSYPESLEESVYMYPFGNLYSSGKICWGHIFRFGEFSNLTVLGEVVNMYFSSEFNNDLHLCSFDYKAVGLKKDDYMGFHSYSSVYSTLCYLNELDHFPNGGLVSTGRSIAQTLSSVVSKSM